MSFEPLCFVTMVRGDHAMFAKWVAYHATLVERRSALHVFLHGEDAQLRRIAEGCSITVLPHDPSGTDFEGARRGLFFNLPGALGGYYRNIIALDCDEFLVVDPALGTTLAAYLDGRETAGSALSPTGLDVIQRLSDEPTPVDMSLPLLEQRSFGMLDGVYCKPCIFRKSPTGGTQHSLKGEAWDIDTNLMLFHFRFFDIAMTDAANRSRMQQVANYNEQGTKHDIGTWADRDRRFRRSLEQIERGEPAELTAAALRVFHDHQIANYVEKGGRLNWSDTKQGPYRIPDRYKSLL